jgi:predicted dehydrogenase
MMAHRVGIIGSGAIADAHVNGYVEAGAQIVAICDADAAVLARRAEQWRVPTVYSQFQDLLDDATIDAVSICAPNSWHHPITLAAARAGKHVLCEKPVSLVIDQAEEMIAACAAAGVVFQVGHHMRSWSAATTAKAIIDRGDIGVLTYARFRQAHDWGGAAVVRGVFGSKAQSGGGTLLDNGCHLFDLARCLCGDARDVFARTATLKFDVEVEDTAIASLGFVSGAIGQIEVAWTATGWQEAFWVFGSQGSLEFDNRAASPTLVHRFRSAGSTSWHRTDVVEHPSNGPGAHAQHVANFLAAIEGERDVVCTGADGLEAVRLVLAAYESAERGVPVRLIDAPSRSRPR